MSSNTAQSHWPEARALKARRKKEEGRRKKEEGRRKKEEGRRKKEGRRRVLILLFCHLVRDDGHRAASECCSAPTCATIGCRVAV